MLEQAALEPSSTSAQHRRQNPRPPPAPLRRRQVRSHRLFRGPARRTSRQKCTRHHRMPRPATIRRRSPRRLCRQRRSRKKMVRSKAPNRRSPRSTSTPPPTASSPPPTPWSGRNRHLTSGLARRPRLRPRPRISAFSSPRSSTDHILPAPADTPAQRPSHHDDPLQPTPEETADPSPS